jgi:hypothetical protein
MMPQLFPPLRRGASVDPLWIYRRPMGPEEARQRISSGSNFRAADFDGPARPTVEASASYLRNGECHGHQVHSHS